MSLLHAVALCHRVSIVLKPGHAGLTYNEATDAAATAASDNADQSQVAPLQKPAAVKTTMARVYDEECLLDYCAKLCLRAALAFRMLRGGMITVDFFDLSRQDAVSLHRLRLNRLLALRTNQQR